MIQNLVSVCAHSRIFCIVKEGGHSVETTVFLGSNLVQQMFDERQLQEQSQGESSRQHETPTRGHHHFRVGTFSLHDTSHLYENNPNYSRRNLHAGSSEERSYEHTPATNSPGLEETIEEWRPSQLVAMPSRYCYPHQSWNFPGIQNLPSYPQAPLSSDFFTILAQYHAYAVNRAQETRQRRCESIKKYREKKRRRNSSRIVKYQMRKQLAERRIRGPRGRFIRKDEENRILQSQQPTGGSVESTREQCSSEHTASFESFLQQKREAFVSPRFCSSHHRKLDGTGRERHVVDCSYIFATDASDYPPPWQYFP
ncbi:hypothetical protein Gasu2_58900 [Galdieria sulphuraria]|nr:hypothetical protein Gasu2_58900 [Galdieria sulphuraria]